MGVVFSHSMVSCFTIVSQVDLAFYMRIGADIMIGEILAF